MALGRDFGADCGDYSDRLAAFLYEQPFSNFSCAEAKAQAAANREPFRKFDKAVSQGVPQNIAMAMFGLRPAGDELSMWDQFTQFVEGSYIVLTGTAKLGSDLYDGNYTGVLKDIDEAKRKSENAQQRWNNPTQAQVLSAAADYKRAFDAEDYGKAYRILSGDPELVTSGGAGGGTVKTIATTSPASADTGMSTGAKVATGVGIVAGGALVASAVYGVATHTPFADVWRHLFEKMTSLGKRNDDR